MELTDHGFAYSATSMRAMAHIASLVLEEVDPAWRADAALEALATVVPYDCAAFVAWDPLAKRYETLANNGYDQEFIDQLHSRKSRRVMRRLGLGRTSGPMRIRDVPIKPSQIWTVREIIWPAGFQDGMSMELYADRGLRYTGMLHVSARERRHGVSDAGREAVSALGPVLGAIADVAMDISAVASRVPEGTSLAGLAADGSLIPLPGAGYHPACAQPAALAKAVTDWLAGPRPHSPFLWRLEGGWLTVHIIRPPARCHLRAVVSIRERTDVSELSERELEVLTLMTWGYSNQMIADQLFISMKTVSTHLGHIFEKLGVHNRTSAAVRAVDEGLVLSALRDGSLRVLI